MADITDLFLGPIKSIIHTFEAAIETIVPTQAPVHKNDIDAGTRFTSSDNDKDKDKDKDKSKDNGGITFS